MKPKLSYLIAITFTAIISIGIASCKVANSRNQGGSELLGSVVRDDNMITEWVFHYGPAKFLKDKNAEDFASNWSSLSDNEQNSMRAGLYVNQHPGYAERYAFSQISKPEAESPWLVALKISSSCRNQDSVVKELPDEMMKNAKFREWIKSPSGSPDSPSYNSEADFTQNCVKPEAFQPFRKSEGASSKCANTIDNFFKSSGSEGNGGIEVVKDSLWPKEGYWYLRSPRCIEQVRSGVADILAMAGEIPDYWAKSPYTDNYQRQVNASQLTFASGDAQLYILLRTMSEVSSLDQIALGKVRSNSKKSDIPGVASLVENIISKASKCSDLSQFQSEIKSYLNFAQQSSNLEPAKGGVEFVFFKKALERQMSSPCGAPNQITVMKQEELDRLEKEEKAKLAAEARRLANLKIEQREAALRAEKNAFRCSNGYRGPYYKSSRPDTGDCSGSQGIEERFSDGSYGYCCYRAAASTPSNSGSSGCRYKGRGYGAKDCMNRYSCPYPKTMNWEGFKDTGGNCDCC